MNEEELKQKIIQNQLEEDQASSFSELPPLDMPSEEGDFEVLVMMKLRELIEEARAIKEDQRRIGHYIRGMNDRLTRIENKMGELK